MQPNVCTYEIQHQLSALCHMRAHCPVRRLTAPVWLSTTMCLHISWYSLTNVLSLNANTNVRNTFSENIYTPGGLGLEMEGGVFCGNVWGEWNRAYTREGCHVVSSGGRVRVGVRVCPCLNALLLRSCYWYRGCV